MPGSTKRRRGRPIIDYPATIPPTSIDISGAAKFFDADGHVRPIGKQIEVKIGQNDREIIDWIPARFGGKVHGPYLI